MAWAQPNLWCNRHPKNSPLPCFYLLEFPGIFVFRPALKDTWLCFPCHEAVTDLLLSTGAELSWGAADLLCPPASALPARAQCGTHFAPRMCPKGCGRHRFWSQPGSGHHLGRPRACWCSGEAGLGRSGVPGDAAGCGGSSQLCSRSWRRRCSSDSTH